VSATQPGHPRDRFEAAWRAGERPRLEDYLAEVPEPDRAELLRVLLAVELAHRVRAGERPMAGEYRLRFPGHDDLIASLCTAVDPGQTGGETPDTPAARGEEELPAVPGYEVLGRLGRGGMGVVYKARQTALKRLVALKMILAGGHLDEQQRQRFRTEAEAVARLQHPNIVQVYEVGEYQGRPYLALEYVDGGSLAQRLAEGPLPAREAARVVETLARAMHAAHERGILHRDLKPANVLLAVGQAFQPDSSRPQDVRLESLTYVPKVTDFGLAKQLDEDAGQTQSGAILGTPSYMAPEQAAGQTHALSPLTDVYALGAVLYELLVGRPPFRAATLLDTLEQVRTQNPVPPRELQPKVPPDLETICLKCLEKVPRQRYASAGALADDLARFRADEPIRARPAWFGERLLKWARRRKAVAALAGLLLLAVAVGGAAGVREYRVAADALRAARSHEYANAVSRAGREIEANQVRRAEQTLAGCPPERRGWEWHYLRRLYHADRLTYHNPTAWAGAVNQLSPDGQWIASAAEDEVVIRRAATGEEVRRLAWTAEKDRDSESAILALACAADGQSLAAAMEDEVRVWSPATGQEVGRLHGGSGGLALAPDGQRLAWGNALWEVATGKRLVTLEAPPGAGPVAEGQPATLYAAFSPDGRFLAAAHRTGAALWDAADGRLQRPLSTTYLPVDTSGMVFSPDGSRLAAVIASPGSGWAELKLWTVADGKEAPAPRRFPPAGALAFSPDGGRLLAAGGRDGAVRLWEAATGQEVRCFPGHTAAVNGLAFTAAGKQLVSFSAAAGEVKAWDATADPAARTFPAGSQAGFSPDGRRLVGAAADGSVTLFDVDTGQSLPLVRDPDLTFLGLGFSADGRRLATAQERKQPAGAVAEDQRPPSRVVTVWDTADGRKVWSREMSAGLGGPAGLALSPDGGRLAVIAPTPPEEWGPDGRDTNTSAVTVWDLTSGDKAAGFHTAAVSPQGAAAFSPDGKLLAVPGLSVRHLAGVIVLRDLEAGTDRVLASNVPLMPIMGVVFSADGSLVGSTGPVALLWDVKTGNPVRVRPEGAEPILLGKDRLAARRTARDGFKLYDPRSGAELAVFQGYEGPGSAFSPDGRRLASAGPGGVKVWDCDSGLELLTLPLPDGWRPGAALAFSDDGRRLTYGMTAWDATAVEDTPSDVGITPAAPAGRDVEPGTGPSLLTLVVVFLVLLYGSRLVSLALLAALHRGNGFIVTSFGLGVARPLLMGSWRGAKVFLARTRPLHESLCAFPAQLYPTRRQRAVIRGGHLLALVLITAACVLLWRLLPWGRELALLAAALFGFVCARAAMASAWQAVRGRAAGLEPIRQVRALRGVWKWIGDGPGLYLQSMRAAAAWADLGGAAEARRLCDDAEALRVEHTAFTQAYGAAVRGRAATAAGDLDEADTALKLAGMGFGALEHDAGLFFVTLGRAELLRARGRAGDAALALAALTAHPLPGRSPDARTALLAAQLRTQVDLASGPAVGRISNPSTSPDGLEIRPTEEVARLRAEYEGLRRRYPSPATDVQVYSALARFHQGRGEWDQAEPAYRAAWTAALDVYAGLRDADDRAAFRECQQNLLRGARDFLRQVGKPDAAAQLDDLFASVDERERRQAEAWAARRATLRRVAVYLAVMDVLCAAVVLLTPVVGQIVLAALLGMVRSGAYGQLLATVGGTLLVLNVLLLPFYLPLHLLGRGLAALREQFRGARPAPPPREPAPLRPDDLPAPRPPKPPPVTKFVPLTVVLCGVVLVLALMLGMRPVRVAVVETVILGLAFFPAIGFTVYLEQLTIALLCRASGFRLTSFGAGVARPVWARTWRGVRLYLARERMTSVLTVGFSTDLLPSPRQFVPLSAGLVLVHGVAAAAALLAWHVCPWGRFAWPWLALLNVLGVGTNLVNVIRRWRGGPLAGSFPARVRQHEAGQARLGAVGDTVGRSIYLLEAAWTWLALENPEHAERLRAEAEALAVPPDDRFPYLPGYAALVRGGAALERGLLDAGREALDEARRAFEGCGSRTGLFLVEWARGRLLLKQGDARQAVAILEGLAADPLLADRPTVRVELLADCVCAQAELPESEKLAALRTVYEAECRRRRVPVADLLDLRVHRALARRHARHEDWAGAEAAYRTALAAYGKLLTAFGNDLANRARFQEACGDVVEEARGFLLRLGKAEEAERLETDLLTAEKRTTAASAEARRQNRRNFGRLGWWLALADLALGLLLLKTVHLDAVEAQEHLERLWDCTLLSALREPVAWQALAGFLLVGSVLALAGGLFLLGLGVLVPRLRGWGGWLALAFALVPWLFWGVMLFSLPLPPNARPGHSGTLTVPPARAPDANDPAPDR
jgi:WD40 repeat protein